MKIDKPYWLGEAEEIKSPSLKTTIDQLIDNSNAHETAIAELRVSKADDECMMELRKRIEALETNTDHCMRWDKLHREAINWQGQRLTDLDGIRREGDEGNNLVERIEALENFYKDAIDAVDEIMDDTSLDLTSPIETIDQPDKPDELKPCQCGRHMTQIEKDDHIFAGQDYGDRYPEAVAKQNHGYRVRCASCGMQTCWWHYEEEAISAWNTRPLEAELRTELADAEYRYETVSKALDMTIEERDGQVDEIERLKDENERLKDENEEYVKAAKFINDDLPKLEADRVNARKHAVTIMLATNYTIRRHRDEDR